MMKGCLLATVAVWVVACLPCPAQAWTGVASPDLPGLKARAKAGDPAAMASYAFHSMRCVGDVPFDQDLIFDYFKRSAAAGNTEGIVGLAHCYTFSVGTTRDLQKSYDLIQKPFKQRHPVALKIMAYHCLGVDEILELDEKRHYALNEEAASKGCVAAEFNLGVADIAGLLGDKKPRQGFERMRKLHERRAFPMATVRLLTHIRENEIWEDDEELYQECYNLAHHFAGLGEPEALYQLGLCHRRAGDEETAIGYFAKAATSGSRAAWGKLWEASHCSVDWTRIWSTSRHRGNLAMRCYDRGARGPSVVSWAAWEYLRNHHQPANQAMFPQLEEDLREALKRSRNAHDDLGRLYDRANPKLNPKLARRDWAIAHLEANSHRSHDTVGMLAFIYSKRSKASAENLAKAWTCAQQARERGDDAWLREGNWKWIQRKLTPKIRELSKELEADEYPTGEKHRRKAEQFLLKEGFVFPRRIE